MSFTRRELGRSGIAVPPILFGTGALANVPKVIPEQRKLAICGEWFRQVGPPVFIDINERTGDGLALEVLAKMLRRLDVAREEVVVHLTLDHGEVRQRWKKCCELLGDYGPLLISIVDASEEELAAARALKEAGLLRGVGLTTNDSHRLSQITSSIDWIVLDRGFNLLHQTAGSVERMAGIARRQIPIVLSGVFGCGFLLGGNKFDGRPIDVIDPVNRSLVAWRTSFAALCHGHGITPAHACIQFALAAPGVFAVKVNSSHPDRVAENVQNVLEKVPAGFWDSMKEEGLLGSDYPDLGW
jgi:D-threo-aldose 1-dehydrogenase